MKTSMKQTAARLPWHKRYPDRWRRELAELIATGWTYAVSYKNDEVRLTIAYPLPDGTTVDLRVRFDRTYPYFPPTVLDPAGALGLRRHWNPYSGALCLIHDQDWHVEMTVAGLITQQLPRALATGAGQMVWQFDAPTDRAVQYEVPEPVAVAATAPAIIVNDVPIPASCEQGALLLGFSVAPGRERLGAGIVETVFAPDFRADVDLDERRMAGFTMPMAGRWIRDPDYRNGDTADQVWKRVGPRLAPLEVDTATDATRVLDPDLVEVVGVLVPDEVAYGELSESWVFLIRTHPREATTGRRRWHNNYRPTQYLDRHVMSDRTPVATALATKSVVVVGVGAVGATIAQDLAQTGVESIVLIDSDTVDVATSPRQMAPLEWAGIPKAFLIQEALRDTAPYSDIHGISGDIARMWERPTVKTPPPGTHDARAMVRHALAQAELVIDATAQPAATRFLAALCRSQGRPFIHASATAGAWGGVVALLTETTGCWACVEHARADQLLPVPAADPTGWVSPRRSCSITTFTGTRPQLAQVSHHASCVAINYLVGEGAMGDYFTASLRNEAGYPQPVAWTVDVLPVHPACQAHGHGPASHVGPVEDGRVV